MYGKYCLHKRGFSRKVRRAEDDRRRVERSKRNNKQKRIFSEVDSNMFLDNFEIERILVYSYTIFACQLIESVHIKSLYHAL